MCGRVVEALDPEWQEYFRLVDGERPKDEKMWYEYPASYNVPPTGKLACMRLDDGHPVAFVAQWGLIPSWAKDRKIGASCSNARADTVDTKPAFRSAYKRRRCLVIVNGFFEWDQRHAVKGTPKQPYYFTLKDGHPFTFAGLWETWRENPESEPLTTCSIITTDANTLMEPFHDRTPVQIPKEMWQPWLDPEQDPAGLKDLLVPYDSDKMQFWPVSKRVNSTRGGDYIRGPECIEPIEPIA